MKFKKDSDIKLTPTPIYRPDKNNRLDVGYPLKFYGRDGKIKYEIMFYRFVYKNIYSDGYVVTSEGIYLHSGGSDLNLFPLKLNRLK